MQKRARLTQAASARLLERGGISFVISALLLLAVDALEGTFQGVLFTMPIAVTAVLSLTLGGGVGVLVTLGTGAGIWFFLQEPARSFAIANQREALRLLSYFVTSFAVVSAIELLHRTRRGLESARRALQEERDFTAATLDTAGSLVLVLDQEGTVVRFNRACEVASGYTATEVTGTSYERFVPTEERPAVRDVIERIKRGDFPCSHESHWQAKDGTQRLFAWSNTAIVDDAGQVRFIVVTGVDITNLKRAQDAQRRANEQLREADRRKNEFLAVLSHELRNPLAPIRNGLHILEHVPPESEQATRARQVIDRQARHMTRMVEDLLDVTRITRGKVTLRRERLELGELLRTTVEDHRELYGRKGIALVFEEAGQPLWVDGDSTRLAQVFGNLLGNSAKFTPPGGKTVVSAGANDGAQAVVRICDTGAGMSGDTLTHIFEPFVQATQSIERSLGGLGLGLSLVRGLVEMHGGQVRAFSVGEGQGANFTVTLPLSSDGAGNTASAPGPGASAPTHRRVLVIEDNRDAAESLREALELEAHEVVVAHSGPEGVEKARACKPEVVLCDIGLPGLDGYGVARMLRADPDPELRAAVLIALSGYAQQEDVMRARDAGFDRHMAKPPSLEALAAVLAELPDRGVAAGRRTGLL